MTEELLTLTSDIVAAHVSHNKIAGAELPALIRSTFEALQNLRQKPEPIAPALTPAVSIRASVKPDYLVCLEDGKKLTMLKRYLHTNFGMTPDEYRKRWGLPRDYPMVAPNYTQKRRELAHASGLGQKRPSKADSSDVASAKAPRKKLGIAAAKNAAAAHLGSTSDGSN